MSRQLDEHLFVSGRADAFQPSTVDDVCSLITKIETTTSLSELIKALLDALGFQLFPPSIRVERVPGKGGFKSSLPNLR